VCEILAKKNSALQAQNVSDEDSPNILLSTIESLLRIKLLNELARTFPNIFSFIA